MPRLLLFLLATLGHVSVHQCFYPTPREANLMSHPGRLKSMKIINGAVADIRDFPYMVSLQYNGTFYGHDYEHFCCGSILNERWVITSAQCAKPYYEEGDVYNIQEALIHPNFNDLSRDYDVALLKLTKDIVFSENVKAIRLPNDNEVIEENTDFSIVGWGAYQLLGLISDSLLKTQVRKIPDQQCKLVYGDSSISSRMFCVFTKGYGACVGDSGSPAVFEGKLIGVASWSYSCAYESPTVYAKVGSVRDWIEAATRTS